MARTFYAVPQIRHGEPGGTFVSTVRRTGDARYVCGTAHGDEIYEHGGFAVHFFPRPLVRLEHERVPAGVHQLTQRHVVRVRSGRTAQVTGRETPGHLRCSAVRTASGPVVSVSGRLTAWSTSHVPKSWKPFMAVT